MTDGRQKTPLEVLKQKQMLRVVTGSFYKELIRHGINKSGILSVSMELLDYVTKGHAGQAAGSVTPYDFQPEEIVNDWKNNCKLSYGAVSVAPLKKEQTTEICDWLNNKSIEHTLIRFFPKEVKALEAYLFDTHRNFLAVYFEDIFVGLIGADSIDTASYKLEMKKFIGSSRFRNRGIGKTATFLFLYYAFEILNMNKVYIHSLDTNISNININNRFGFELEGLLYHDIFIEDSYHDVLRMGLLKSKWHRLFPSLNSATTLSA